MEKNMVVMVAEHTAGFCIYCWQRYLCNYRHIARMCKEGRILRKLGTFSANNNGDQWADTEEANAQLD